LENAANVTKIQFSLLYLILLMEKKIYFVTNALNNPSQSNRNNAFMIFSAKDINGDFYSNFLQSVFN
jgi:poly(3-hydroxyalkanoate) synthetase